MSRSLSPNARLSDVIAAVRTLAQEIDSVRNGKFTIRSDVDFGGKRIRNLGKPVESRDAQTRIQDLSGEFAPIGAAYVVAGNLDVDLTHERLLAAGDGIEITDNGAGSTVVVAADQAFFDALYQPLDAQLTSLASLAYTGNTLKLIRVNAGETGFELVAPSGLTAGVASTVTVADAAGDTTTFPVLAGSATGDLPMLTDAGLSYNATTNALTATTFLGNVSGTTGTFSSLTAGRVPIVSTAGLLADDADMTFATDTLSVTKFQQATNNAGGFLGKPTSGTNDYSLFVNSSNEWELRQNVGGVVNATYKWGGAEFYPGAKENLGKTTAGWGAVVFQGATSGDATLQPPAVAGTGTVITLPGATGTLATLAGTETLTNKTLTTPTINDPAINIDNAASGVGSLSMGNVSFYNGDGTMKFVRHPRLLSAPAPLGNGANNNVDPSSVPWLYVSGPTGAFSITGFVAPAATNNDGMLLYVYNSTSQNMTIAHESASSTAANRIKTMTGADVTTTGAGFFTLIYSTTDSRWLLVSQNL